MQPQDIVQALRDALSGAVDNLPDVAGDPLFPRAATIECCADIAALSHLLGNDDTGQPRILAYV